LKKTKRKSVLFQPLLDLLGLCIFDELVLVLLVIVLSRDFGILLINSEWLETERGADFAVEKNKKKTSEKILCVGAFKYRDAKV